MKRHFPKFLSLSVFCIFSTTVCVESFATDLCNSHEKAVFSFQGKKSKKLVSICKAEDSEYLVYRFGTAKKIELQFPDTTAANSWRRFAFSGSRRGGGKANAGFGDYSLSFSNGAAEYYVFQVWSDEDGSYSIGVNVQVKGKSVTLEGDRKTQQGSLVLLESENERIPNSYNQ